MSVRKPVPSMEGVLSKRLLFRRLRAEDVEWWMGYINDAAAIRFMPFMVGDRSDCTLMIQRSLDRYSTDGSGLNAIILQATGEPVGQCGLLTQMVDDQEELEIGYHLLPTHWGKGYATEAAIRCKAFATEHRLSPSVISLIDPGNHQSQAVARRNGMSSGATTVHRGHPALVFRTMLATDHLRG